MNEGCASPCLFDWLRLATSTLTPLSIAGLGILAKVYADGLERRRMLFEVEARWRIEVFRELLSRLNQTYCYFTYQGDWLSMSPDDATAVKRASDRIVFSNRFLWSGDFLEAYKKFTATAFLENQGPGRPFLFRANVTLHKKNPNWKDAWEERFVAESDRVRRKEFLAAYEPMLRLAVRDIGISRAAHTTKKADGQL